MSDLRVDGLNKLQLSRLSKVPRTRQQRNEKVLVRNFHIVLSNCARYTLDIFGSLVTCRPQGVMYGPILLPRACRPIPGLGGYMPPEEECARVVD